ncbi:hemophore-related protein [Mycolicibacterium smegmatis]|uniref:hemophore-related protein n=1 Tax=Mycolicibacterium smegmatis TaxID=1772 RepID=UPI00071AF763|nr:hemophore-related protein [Mycolicibacterium smegmatis]MDF1897577.1 hemophore-related protein [Mycolicibacterium smegmatis]MDF1903980.1 hemophore-related protein [Mycolicibacterium smegmatis]MDF1917143.1 hemophore-related protein [Mycolicibacterium smegmatis]MDF1922517.1 hemophore-related protein [Mycolicibacterium smegmatis]UAK56396.1 hemophore-related protein [Mycolicibacterium smegmatis]
MGVAHVFTFSRTKLAIAAAGLAAALPLSAGIASAQPDFSAVVNTTCSYEQVMAALNAQQPDLAAQFNTSPMAQGMLRNFLAAAPAERQQTVNQLQTNPMAQQYFGTISSIASSCSRY